MRSSLTLCLLCACGRIYDNAINSAAVSPLLADVSIEAIAPGDECAAGGAAVVLSEGSNVVERIPICRGITGGIGATGAMGDAGAAALVIVASEGACQRVRSGFDADGDGVLGAGEERANTLACAGEKGTAGAGGVTGGTGPAGDPVLVAIIGTGACTGGAIIQSGYDLDRDDVLDPGEITRSDTVCAGNNGGGAGGAGGGMNDPASPRAITVAAPNYEDPPNATTLAALGSNVYTFTTVSDTFVQIDIMGAESDLVVQLSANSGFAPTIALGCLQVDADRKQCVTADAINAGSYFLRVTETANIGNAFFVAVFHP